MNLGGTLFKELFSCLLFITGLAGCGESGTVWEIGVAERTEAQSERAPEALHQGPVCP